MSRRMLAALIAGTIWFGGSPAFAHKDHNADGNRSSTKRCDTYYRQGHAKDAQGRTENQSGFDSSTAHSEDHTSEFDTGEIAPGGQRTGVYVHNHSGHYVVRHDAAYVEAVGGGGYNRGGNQGGYVQGEVDPVAGGPDADFHANAFAGDKGSMHSEAACVAAADQQQIGDEGTQP